MSNHQFVKPREPRASTPNKIIDSDSFISDVSVISPYLNAGHNRFFSQSEHSLVNASRLADDCAKVTLRPKVKTGLRRSSSMCNINIKKNKFNDIKQVGNLNPSKPEQNSIEDDSDIDTLILQCLAEKHLMSRKHIQELKEMQNKLATTQESILTLMESLSKAKRRINEVEFLKHKEVDLNNIEKECDKILQKTKKVDKNELQNLIIHLKIALNKFPIENIAMPETRFDVLKVQNCLSEISKNLNNYTQLETKKHCNVGKLAKLIGDFSKICAEIENSSERCKTLQTQLSKCVVQETATEIMSKSK